MGESKYLWKIETDSNTQILYLFNIEANAIHEHLRINNLNLIVNTYARCNRSKQSWRLTVTSLNADSLMCRILHLSCKLLIRKPKIYVYVKALLTQSLLYKFYCVLFLRKILEDDCATCKELFRGKLQPSILNQILHDKCLT